MADIAKTNHKGLGLPKHFDPSMEQMKKNMEVIDDILQKAVPNDLASTSEGEASINALVTTGRYLVKSNATGYPVSGYAGIVDVFRVGTYILQEWRSITTSTYVYRRYSTNSGSSWNGWIEDWNASNDGSGSGLDADLLDGLNSTAFSRIYNRTVTDFNSATSIGFWCINGSTNAPNNSGSLWGCIVFSTDISGSSISSSWLCQIAIKDNTEGNTLYYRKKNGSSWSSWQTIWSTSSDGTANDILTKLKTVDGTGSGLAADLLDGQHEYQMAKYGDVSGTLPTTRDPTATTTGGCQTFRFKDSSNLIGEGANRYYGIIQIYYSSSYYIRIAVSMTSGKVYRQTNGQTAWNEITPLIPVLTSDPPSPSEGQMWILNV